MLSRVSLRNSGPRAVFYRTDDGFEDIVTGSLLKSPPTGLLKTLKSWKRRFFVLKKTSDNAYILKYYKSDEDRSKPQGVIDISTISYIYLSPENHVKWNVIQKMFKCSPEMVLFIRSGLRDYFLIGENKEEMDLWFESIYNILMSLSQKEHWSPERVECLTQRTRIGSKDSFSDQGSLDEEELKIRSSSDPEMTKECSSIKEGESKSRSSSNPETAKGCSTMTEASANSSHNVDSSPRYSDPEVAICPSPAYYDVPRNIMKDVTERNGRDFEKTEENGPSFYMEMESVYKTAKEVQPSNTDDAAPPCSKDKDDLGESNESLLHTINVALEGLQFQIKLLNEDQQRQTVGITENQIPVEKDVYINQSDLKDSLFLTEVDGKPCISQCLGLPNSGCLFHKGDQILAVNDLQTQNVKEVQTYLSKLLKAQVKITIQRIPGSGLLNSDTCACD
uniref:Pleckstrin homology domain containing S1, tandem duplicate 3 n=1 Tax=Lepisosteus oculatus TaxID=7918 RepID=W5N2J2_LEPOC|nr:PREDICTED: pleckstrin homology domain-containing family S member 1 isoform X1 [Lepisosteus oculatus]